MNQNIIKYGLYAGAGTIAYLLLFYYMDPRMMFNTWVQWSYRVIFIAAMVAATLVERRAAEDGFSFRQAVRPAFGVYVVASLIYLIFFYVMFNYVNTDLPEIQRAVLVEQSQFLAEKLGMVEMQEQMEQIKVEDLQVTFRNSSLDFMWRLIFGFILSAILALILRRER
jgi:hypothetical protein